MEQNAGQEEIFSSPSDRIKNIILNRLEQCERFFTDGETEKFINGTKSLKRVAFMQISKDNKDKLRTLDENEKAEVEVIWNKKESELSTDKKKEERKKILEKYANERIELLIEAISSSAIVEKDIEVDFNINEHIEVLRAAVKENIEDGGNGSRFS